MSAESNIAEREAELLALIEAASPGPWHWDWVKEHKLRPADDGASIAYVHPGVGSPDESSEQWKATRRLIALAPGLAVAVRIARALREASQELHKRLRNHFFQQHEPDDWMRCDDGECPGRREALAEWDKLLGKGES